MRTFCLILSVFLMVVKLAAQKVEYQNSVQDFITKSTPQAFQFQKYGDLPVNYNTGVVDISIPLFSVGIKNVNWNVGISYHTGGIKVNEVSGCVGLGWNLNAAGMISAKTFQRSDVFVKNEADSTAYRRSFTLTASYPSGQINECTYASPSDAGFAYNYNEWKTNGSPINFMPDIFYLNAGELSAKFFLKGNNLGYCLPSKDIKIEHFPGNGQYNSTPGYWIVTDEKGTKYTFEYGGGNVSTTGQLNPSDSSGGESLLQIAINLSPIFVLKKIENVTGEKIWFYYTTESYYYKTGEVDTYHLNANDPQPQGCNNPIDGFLSILNKYTYNTIQESRLDSIYSSNGESIVFSYSSRQDLIGSSKLNRITKYFRGAGTYKFIKAYDFVNDYFGSGSNCRDLRLKLLRLREMNASNDSAAVYTFFYDNTQLPSRISPAQDSAGFYNGQTGNTNLVPVYGGDRSYSLSHTKACTLEKITYPTGGYTKLEYELKLTGGLRIKKKVDSTLNNGYSYKEYSYGQPYFINGSSYYKFSKELLFYYQYCSLTPDGNPPQQATCPATQTYSHPIVDIYDSYYGDSKERYYTVTEFNGTNGSGGKREFTYWGEYLGLLFTIPPGMMGFEDLLREKKVYQKIDPGYALIESEETSYSLMQDTAGLFSNPSNSREARAWGLDFEFAKEEQISTCLGQSGYGVSAAMCHPAQIIQHSFMLLSSPIMIDTIKTLFYEGYQVLENKKGFSYDIIKNLSPKMITTFSSTSMVAEVMKYPTDFSNITATDEISTGIKNLFDKHIYKETIEKSVYRLNLDSTNIRLINSTFSSYKSTLPVPSKLFTIETSTGISNFTPSSEQSGAVSKDNRYVERVLFNGYNSYGDPFELQKKDDLKTNYIWDEKNTDSGKHRLPIASVINADSTSIAYTSFELDGKGKWTYSGNTSIDHTSPTGRKCYDIAEGNITKSGLTSATYIVSYWGKNGSVNVNSAGPTITGNTIGDWTYYEHEVSTTSITISGNKFIDELRLYPKGALMTTYTYSPLIGMTSHCDPNNRIMYYEYDSFNRLFLVRDQDKNVIRKLCYNYSGQPENCNIYYNVQKNGNYTRNNCAWGYEGTTVTYIVYAGTYTSNISQEYIDSVAQAQVNAYGQAYANTNGTCTYVGCTTSNCTGEQWKCVNGNCEQGVKVYTSSEYNWTFGWYECTFHYEWSDYSWSENYIEYHSEPCAID